MPRRHRSHSTEFKRQVVAEYHAGETGMARNRNETAIDLSTLSVPVLGADSAPVAALTLAFPSKVVRPWGEE